MTDLQARISGENAGIDRQLKLGWANSTEVRNMTADRDRSLWQLPDTIEACNSEKTQQLARQEDIARQQQQAQEEHRGAAARSHLPGGIGGGRGRQAKADRPVHPTFLGYPKMGRREGSSWQRL
jgi:hypothetical protein